MCPGSYMFKIQTFSLISEFVRLSSTIECFDSPAFESDGHKWKLSIYPNGNKKLGVEDHVSMYLVAADADSIDSIESGIRVMFKMFVYDHFHDKFLTIQDNEVRRFHGLKKDWGFARLISLERFKDANNGYLVNDCCVFGVEIFVLTPGISSGIGNLVMIKQPSDGIFTCKLDSFPTLSEVVTKEFEVQGHQLMLAIHPKGNSSGNGTHLSMFLRQSGSGSGSKKAYISCVLRVRDQVNGMHYESTLSCCFAEPDRAWGFQKFILLSDLKDKTSGFILNDSLIAEVEVNLISKDAGGGGAAPAAAEVKKEEKVEEKEESDDDMGFSLEHFCLEES
ncbi:unnamed protein product [Rhodiola kirilowii]